MRFRVPAVLVLALVTTVVSARPTQAAAIIGAQLFATGGDVLATFMGHTAGFTNDLYVFDASDLSTPLAVTAIAGPGFGGAAGLIFTNHVDAPGATVNLGSFAAGTELVFGIFVRNTGDVFYMGPGARNADGLAHGAVDNGAAPQFPDYGTGPIPAGMVGVGFEDLLGGGDLDYDDLGFAFSNVRSSVPEPATLLLLGLGLAGAARRRVRR